MGLIGVSILCVVTPLLIYWFVPPSILLPRKARLLRNHDKLSPPQIETMEPPTDSLDLSKDAAISSLDKSRSQTSTTPSITTSSASSTSELMPPPPRPTTLSTSQLPSASTPTSTLRIPSNGPLPNRSLAAGSNSSTLLTPFTKPPSLNTPNRPAPSASSINPGTTSSKPRGRVLLPPGHSPLDWAQLTRSGRNLAGVPSPQKVTASQLAWHNGRQGRPAWAAWKGRVYNITEYLPFHPGGKGELMRAAGKHGEAVETLFLEVHPWVSWESMLGACWVGWLVEDSR